MVLRFSPLAPLGFEFATFINTIRVLRLLTRSSCLTSFPSFSSNIFALCNSIFVFCLAVQIPPCTLRNICRGIFRVTLFTYLGMGPVRSPRFLGNSFCICPVLRLRRNLPSNVLYSMVDTVPEPPDVRDFHNEAHFGALLHSFCSRFLRFTHHVTMAHAKLASGCLPNFTEWDFHPQSY